ncbi:MAG: YgeY family selenium metabolism-linked hydrolase [Planctomycetes bacterium]|nr:YgeY family selenium metabolism-linked hydrolase [Planctomycetota bacterium]
MSNGVLNPAVLLKRAAREKNAMVKLLRDLVRIPGESGMEGPVIGRICEELDRSGVFDRVWVDPFGNLLAQIGRGKRLLAIDAHVDTVGVGDRSQWKHDPYEGKVSKAMVYGRGAGDQRGAVPPMILAARMIREHALLPSDASLLLTFTVCEEDCDGLCWQYIVREDKIRPECVIVTDSTDCRILRGQRGRMEIGVTVRGRSCHGSMPHKGDNAVYKISRVVQGIERLNERGLRKDPFLGNGTITVTYVDCKTPSLCAVPDQAYIHLDRRLTTGDTKASALREVRGVLKQAGVAGEVRVLRYAKPTHTGLVFETESFFPTWCASPDAPQVRAAVRTYESLWRKKPRVGRWTFSTNGVAIAGMHKIPTVGFGPAPESVAHTVNDSVPAEHLVKCAAFYAAFPSAYFGRVARSS